MEPVKVTPIPDRSELAEELAKITEVYRRVERVIPLEELRSKLKDVARRVGSVEPARVERALISMFRGEVKPEQAVEEIIASSRSVEEGVQRVTQTRVETPKEVKPIRAKVETPKGG